MCGLISAYAQASQLNNLLPPVRLAVVNSFGSNLSVRYFNGTVNAIAKAVAPRRLVVQFYDQEVFLEAAQNKGFDLAIASSGLTALMTDASGAAALLTIINSRTPDPNHANAGVIVVRSDRDDINCLADLKGKTVAVSSTKAFAGFLAVMGEIQAEGLNPNRLFKSVTATHKPMTELVKQVVNKEVDVAFIASCLLENMEADGVIPKGCFKVINEKKDENFYCKHSTLNSKCTLTGAENLFVYADPLNVDLVLMNLLKNAEEAVRNQQNAEIKVEIKNAGADALVIIEDNGPDMTDDQFASLRNLGQSSKKDGLGLGLAIVRELLEANGGSLKLVRIPSGGLRCIASLPIALEDKDGPG